MSNDNEQENNNELKVISKIEIDTKPKNYGQFEGNLAKVGYVQGALDKLIKELNKEFVPELDSVLDSIKSELNELKEDMPVVLGSEPFHVTGEENGLL